MLAEFGHLHQGGDPRNMLVDRPALVAAPCLDRVAAGLVKIPDGTEIQLTARLFVHIERKIHIVVEEELVDQHVIHKGSDVAKRGKGIEIPAEDGCVDAVNVIRNIGELRRVADRFIGGFDHGEKFVSPLIQLTVYLHGLHTEEGLFPPIDVAAEFDEVANVGSAAFSVTDIKPLAVLFNALGGEIKPLVGAVDIKLNEAAFGRVVRADGGRQLEGGVVLHKGNIHRAGIQNEVLCRAHPHQVVALIEFQAVGFFLKILPGGVAAPAHGGGDTRKGPFARHRDGGRQIFLARDDGRAARGVDLQNGNGCLAIREDTPRPVGGRRVGDIVRRIVLGGRCLTRRGVCRLIAAYRRRSRGRAGVKKERGENKKQGEQAFHRSLFSFVFEVACFISRKAQKTDKRPPCVKGAPRSGGGLFNNPSVTLSRATSPYTGEA